MTRPVAAGLGRRFVGHDDRSRGYAIRPLLAAQIVRRPTWWALPPGPFPLDQGAEGECTGYGYSHMRAAGPVTIPNVDNAYAHRRYLRNQAEDRAMGNTFPDGATVLATMKAAQADGEITGYRWCFGVDDVVDTVCTVGPVCLGISWYESMYSTTKDGRVTITGANVGGHFITIVGYADHPAGGPSVLWLNTWGTVYGVANRNVGVPAGIGWLALPDLARLLADDGEAVLPADFLAQPVMPDPLPPVFPPPEPSRPVPPPPPPTPTPPYRPPPLPDWQRQWRRWWRRYRRRW